MTAAHAIAKRPVPEQTVKTRASETAPALSILTPFFRDDPVPLMRKLARVHACHNVELILVSDGGSAAATIARVVTAAEALPFAVTLIVFEKNQGRAIARNRLIEEARGRHVLFLDADMAPIGEDFVDCWLDMIAAENPAVAFGGFSVDAIVHPDARVHHGMSTASECLSAAERARDPAQFLATSNLLVRRDVLASTPFDDGFVGWGWEDVDWALRAAHRAHIMHVDIPAIHKGLDTVETLLRKYTEAGPNYGRLAQKHPSQVRQFRSYRAARALSFLPGLTNLRAILSWFARDPFGVTPLRARCAALRLYRSAIYAEHLP
ncbi:MAG: glycosyltransferase family A protein [Caulobacterales bacterium]